MPYKPFRQCPGKGPHQSKCSNLVKTGDRYCKTCSQYLTEAEKRHNRLYDKERESKPERKFIHSDRWRKIREKKLHEDPLCEMCLRIGIKTFAVLVHHKDGNELNNAWDNYQSLCTSCHNAIHKHSK